MLLLVVGWLVQAGLRVWFSRHQVMPLANPDETAYLIAARVLAGGPGLDLSGSTLYQGGYPLLITPVYWFTSNPATVYHAVLVINAAISAACATALFGLATLTVAVYAGSSLPTAGFGSGFSFAEPAVLTWNWTQASVPLAAAVTLGLLAVWIGLAFILRRWQAVVGRWRAAALAFGACVASDLDWQLWVPQAFEISWTELQFFNPASQPPPAGVTVVEAPWPAGLTARASWPDAPAGWRIADSDQAYAWVVWRKA